MNQDERVQLVKGLLRLAALHPRIEISDETVEAYADELDDMPLVAVMTGIKTLARSSRFFPSVAEIREAAVLGPLGQDLADEAWVEVKAEARRVGFNRPPVFSGGRFLPAEAPKFSSPLIAAAANAVGWELVCNGDDSQGFIRSQFLKAFKALVERETKAKQAGVMPVDGEAIDGIVIGGTRFLPAGRAAS